MSDESLPKPKKPPSGRETELGRWLARTTREQRTAMLRRHYDSNAWRYNKREAKI